MTEEEKELEQKIKQYQYEEEENKKKLETLSRDMHKGRKKTLIFRINKTIGSIIIGWFLFFCTLVGLALIWSLLNYVQQLQRYDPVRIIEDIYSMNLKELSREVGDKEIIYKVKPTKWKYNKIEFTIYRKGGMTNDDFGERYLKYIVDNIEQKELLDGFEIQEEEKETKLLDYKLIYKFEDDESSKIADQKIQDLKNYIFKKDKKAGIYINLNELIIKEEMKNEEISN